MRNRIYKKYQTRDNILADYRRLRMYIILYVLYAVLLLVFGFVHTSRGSKITEQIRTIFSLIAVIFMLSLIVLSAFERSIFMAVAAIIMYFWIPGVSQTITLYIMGRRDLVSNFAKFMTLLFLFVVLYIIINSRIIAV